jgi:rubrerythrin
MSGGDEFGVNENTRPEEAVRIAMEREKKARAFYLACAGIVADPGVKKMFEFLAREEGKHFDLLEREHDRFIAGEN